MPGTLPHARTFAERLALRDARFPVVATGDRLISRDELVQVQPASGVPSDSRVALSIRSASGLLKAVAAFDGYVSTILLLSSTLAHAAVSELVREAGCTALVTDRDDLPGSIALEQAIAGGEAPPRHRESSWVLTTSGTTGRPKMISHTLASLSRTVQPARPGRPPRWGLVYEPTRFAGLQVVLQACLGGGILIVPGENLGASHDIEVLERLNCTHLSATPTLWRRILMHPASAGLQLEQITLGGEIADQSLLNALRLRFPAARITHVYASTETGVGFSVRDGREGFPAAFLQDPPNGVDLKVVDGRLWVRPPGRPSQSLGSDHMVRDAAGFVDTTDKVEFRGDRVVFLGRDNGAVNVGGTKVYPEVIERFVNAIPGIAFVRVSSKRNPISGALIVATIVPSQPVEDVEAFKSRVIQYCRAHLPREAVPAAITVADSLDINSAGKLDRH